MIIFESRTKALRSYISYLKSHSYTLLPQISNQVLYESLSLNYCAFTTAAVELVHKTHKMKIISF